ncbi:MAG: ComEA family DNA-binding protein, partial [Actinobacteria bacterium]|nr:ComEA family DNA-binding protein [Actinomycetota bacterium]NIS31087.1 ComEA family DNA-binding protein [Actinomycetota bacterium]NIT95472.1 ComEA family DNA-binding protein [Actinomycetota bacterium]NIU19154.1 ComEA family DNA-binding protein [Actinomycetota bacterium]NIU66248.1 ComEA family DNA-binding protein [Actinomycetota bacterium]
EVLPRIDTVSAAGGAPAVAPEAEAGAGPGGPVVIVVHVDGAVARPGVHELAPGSRVVDAIDAAQGLRADADRSRLNLAAPV